MNDMTCQEVARLLARLETTSKPTATPPTPAASVAAVADDAVERLYDLASVVRIAWGQTVELAEYETELAHQAPHARDRLRLIGDVAAFSMARIVGAAGRDMLTATAERGGQ